MERRPSIHLDILHQRSLALLDIANRVSRSRHAVIRDRSLSSVLLLTLHVPLRGGKPGRLAADVSRSPKGLVVSHLLPGRSKSLGKPGGLSSFAGT